MVLKLKKDIKSYKCKKGFRDMVWKYSMRIIFKGNRFYGKRILSSIWVIEANCDALKVVIFFPCGVWGGEKRDHKHYVSARGFEDTARTTTAEKKQ